MNVITQTIIIWSTIMIILKTRFPVSIINSASKKVRLITVQISKWLDFNPLDIFELNCNNLIKMHKSGNFQN